MKKIRPLLLALLCALRCGNLSADGLGQALGELPFQLVYESYDGDNWELFVMAADGSRKRNLTNTKDQHELYPQASPDGKRICFVCDVGSGRDVVRSVCVMEADGSGRKTIADHARQPFWCPDSKTIGFLPQEFPKFNVVDYFTKGMRFYDTETGETREFQNAEKMHHLYNPSFAANGKWIVSTVHAGMGHKHGILLIEAEGERILDLGIGGCRPCLSPDGKKIAWGESDHKIAVAELLVDAAEPKVGKRLFEIVHPTDKLYHVDWAPDSKHLSFSRGVPSKGDITKPGTHEAACEIVGVYAAGWDLLVVAVPDNGGDQPVTLDLASADAGAYANVTSNGLSNKESSWLNRRIQP